MEAFVYCWTNHTKNRKYIGYHAGSKDDGYICSARNKKFWADFKTDHFTRQIIASGTISDCVSLENEILKKIDLNDGSWYNMSSNMKPIIWTDELRQQHSEKMKGRVISWGDKISLAKQNKPFPSGNPMDNPISRKKVSDSKIGTKSLRKNGKRKLAKPGSEKWNTLINEGWSSS